MLVVNQRLATKISSLKLLAVGLSLILFWVGWLCWSHRSQGHSVKAAGLTVWQNFDNSSGSEWSARFAVTTTIVAAAVNDFNVYAYLVANSDVNAAGRHAASNGYSKGVGP